MDNKEVSNLRESHRPRGKRLPILSLFVWGVIGLVVGFVLGGLGTEVSGAQGMGDTVVNVGVKVFGITVRQGKGPESMDQVVSTWGFGLIGIFALLGAGVGIVGRMVVHGLLRQRNPSS